MSPASRTPSARRVLVTGADGFVGSWVLRALLQAGHDVTGSTMEARPRNPILSPAEWEAVRWLHMDLARQESVNLGAQGGWDAVIHLAAVSGSGEAALDVGHGWNINAGGTARLLYALARRPEAGPAPRFLLVSTSEVYGEGAGRPPFVETDPVAPLSPYAASKAGAEIAARQAARQAGIPLVVARPWPHTGPGQQAERLIPRWILRLRHGEREIAFAGAGGVRDYLDVRDVTAAYLALLTGGEPGETYNIASGRGETFAALFGRLAAQLGVDARLRDDPGSRRGWDAQQSVGDAARLHRATGWSPRIPLDQTFADMLHAQTD